MRRIGKRVELHSVSFRFLCCSAAVWEDVGALRGGAAAGKGAEGVVDTTGIDLRGNDIWCVVHTVHANCEVANPPISVYHCLCGPSSDTTTLGFPGYDGASVLLFAALGFFRVVFVRPIAYIMLKASASIVPFRHDVSMTVRVNRSVIPW